MKDETGLRSELTRQDLRNLPSRKSLWTGNQIEEVRKYFIQMGWISKEDIHMFIPCGRPKGRLIYEKIVKDIKAQGHILPVSNRIPVKVLVDDLGLTQYKKYFK